MEAEKMMAYLNMVNELSWVRTNFEETLPGALVEIDP
jgi:hypothetical protein